MIGANQYTQQLVRNHDTTLLDAVLGTAGTFVSFRIGPDDAELLGPILEQNPNNLMHCPPFTAYVATPNATNHLYMPQVEAKQYPTAAKAIENNCGTQYGRPIAKVQRRIDDFIKGAS